MERPRNPGDNAVMARQRTRSERAELVNEYRSSGQSAYRFSLERGVAASLSRWILDDVRESSVPPEEVAFVRVEITKSTPRRSALFVFFGKRRQTVKVLSWDGTGVVLWYKRLGRGRFEIPDSAAAGDTSVLVSDSQFESIFAGLVTQTNAPPRRLH